MPESTRGRGPGPDCSDAEPSGAVVVDMAAILAHDGAPKGNGGMGLRAPGNGWQGSRMAPPTLTDGTVTLRAHRPEDAQGSFEQSRDPLSQRWTTVPVPYTMDDARAFVE